MYSILVCVVGLIIGSFLNVCIYRIPREESISFPPSHCTNCDNKIKAYDLIPVLSYIFLKGKCRHCKEKISIKYPIIELITCALFLVFYIKFGLTFELVKFSVFTCFMLVIGIIDLETTDVYVKTTICGLIAGIIFVIAGHFYGLPVLTYIYGGVLGGGIITIIILLTHGMGWGDVEICLLAGIFLGLKLTVVMLLFSFVLGGVIGVLLILTKKKTRKDYIPFGPFIALGAIGALMFGQMFINLYIY
jgi:leader peptidase (prepilin peptidase) / N-methyltransferase